MIEKIREQAMAAQRRALEESGRIVELCVRSGMPREASGLIRRGSTLQQAQAHLVQAIESNPVVLAARRVAEEVARQRAPQSGGGRQ